MENISTHINFEKLDNTRDLGGIKTVDGKTIKTGLLYRSGRLHYASKNDIKKLNSFKIRKVFDFRKPSEAGYKPNPKLRKCEDMNISIINFNNDKDMNESKYKDFSHFMIEQSVNDKHHGHKTMLDIYEGIVASDFANHQYALFINSVAALRKGQACLWHCSSGKDRAGFATVLILAILGAPLEDIKKDYLSTNLYTNYGRNHVSKSINFEQLPENAQQTLIDLYLVKEEYWNVWMNYIDKNYGSMDNYIKEALHVKKSVIRRIKEKYLY